MAVVRKKIGIMIKLQYHRIGCTVLRRFAEYLRDNGGPPIANTNNVKVTGDKQYMLLMKLLSTNPEPFVEYLNGERGLRRIFINGSGTKKDPYRCEWSDDYYQE